MRNLQEQVQKNKEDIAKHYAIDRAMANLGIKVVGQVSTPQQLPGITNFPEAVDYQGEYGDTYAVGNKAEVDAGNASYEYWVFTRPDPNAGYTENYWLNVGRISIEGPQGPQGKPGDKGDPGQSTRWYTGEFEPANPNIGDLYLNKTGMVFQFTESGWIAIESIVGPQGAEGPRGKEGPQGPDGNQGLPGERGPAGGFTIAGILSQPPTEDPDLAPEVINNLNIAYLVGSSEPYDLWIQIGTNIENAEWSNQGPISGATAVVSNGVFQTTWNADTKLDKVTSSGFLRAYCVNPDGSQNTISIASNPNTWKTDRMVSLMRSTAGSEDDRSKMENANVGYLLSPAPVQPFHTANKEYVDKNFVPDLIKDNPDYGLVQAVVMTAKQGPDPRSYGAYTISTSTGGVQSGRIAQYFGNDSGAEGTALGNGRVLQHDPVQPLQVANKRYVDNSTKIYRHKISGSLINTASETKVINFIVYNNNPNPLITPDNTETAFSTIATKYLQPSTPVMLQTASEYEMDMIKATASNAFNLIISGDRYNFVTASGFVDTVTEIE